MSQFLTRMFIVQDYPQLIFVEEGGQYNIYYEI